MSNISFFLFAVVAVICFLSSIDPISACAPIELRYPNGTVAARSRRSIGNVEVEFPVTLTLLTEYIFDNAFINQKNVDIIEKEIQTIVKLDNPGKIKFAVNERVVTANENGYLHISFTFFQGPLACENIAETFQIAILPISKVKESKLVCENENYVIKAAAKAHKKN
uniref:Uncharacterized protein n=1 Tax=Panagrolaimus sp. ES5 TaxID=591445 RepID=A0AC34F737_9BILA